MKQEVKSKKSKEMILKAGLELFSKQGYRATSIKEISQLAGISIGRLYHHYTNKLEIFTSLLDAYWARLTNPEVPLNKLSAEARFPDDFTAIAEAIHQVVADNQAYIMLIYIDVIEFHGEHIQRFYRDMAHRFREVYGERFEELRAKGLLREGADPYFAVMLTFRFFFHYFLVETSFGVEDHFGYSTQELIQKAQQIILGGLLKDPEQPA